jgi:hypothetical protein
VIKRFEINYKTNTYMQTLVFNTTAKTVKVYEGAAEKSELNYQYDFVPTVKIMEGYYEIMQTDKMTDEERRYPVARFPITNTNMILKK